MSGTNLTVLPSFFFPQIADELVGHMVRRVDQIMARAEIHSELGSCLYDEEGSSCKQLGTVHHLGREVDYCLRHFEKVERRG